jgi:hypothetical protein
LPWQASCCSERSLMASAPVLQRPSIEILDHFREWIAGRDSP